MMRAGIDRPGLALIFITACPNLARAGGRPAATEDQIFGLIILAVLVGLYRLIKSAAGSSRKLSEGEKDAMVKEAEALLSEIKSGKLSSPEVGLLLQKGEVAILAEPSTLHESRSTRIYGGAGTRIKGISIFGGQSTSVQSLKRVDAGQLILTNQRLVFDGGLENRVVAFKDVLSVEMASDAIEVSVSGKAKSQTYAVKNPVLWSVFLKCLASGDLTVTKTS